MKGVFKPFNVKRIDIETGELIALLHEDDAKDLGVLPLDRVIIKNNGDEVAVVVNVTKKMVPKGTVGLFEDIIKKMTLKEFSNILVSPTTKPDSVKYIKEKMDGKTLDYKKIKAIVDDINSNKLSKIEMTGLMSGIYMRGLDLDESYEMAKNIAQSGRRLELGTEGVIVDKHSIGGTNGRATMVVVPIVASAGLYMPKTSSRAITSAAGTADSMEVLAGVNFDFDELKNIVLKTNAAIVWGGGIDLAPVDDKMIKVEYPLSLDPRGQVVASVLAKKYCVGAQKVIIDMPVGKDLKVKTIADAESMAQDFVVVGRRLGMDVRALITNGAAPSGPAFGPALEARHALEVLEGKTKDTMTDKALELAGRLIELGGKASEGEGFNMAKKILESGTALKKMKDIISAQGKKYDKSTDVPIGEYKCEIRADAEMFISSYNMKTLVEIARAAGAPNDLGSGIVLNTNSSNKLYKDDLVMTIYSNNQQKLDFACSYTKKNSPIEYSKMILKEI